MIILSGSSPTKLMVWVFDLLVNDLNSVPLGFDMFILDRCVIFLFQHWHGFRVHMFSIFSNLRWEHCTWRVLLRLAEACRLLPGHDWALMCQLKLCHWTIGRTRDCGLYCGNIVQFCLAMLRSLCYSDSCFYFSASFNLKPNLTQYFGYWSLLALDSNLPSWI